MKFLHFLSLILLAIFITISQNCAPTVSTVTTAPNCCAWPFTTNFINTANATVQSCLTSSINFFCVNTAGNGLATILGNVSSVSAVATSSQLIGGLSTNATVTLVCNTTTGYYNFILPGSTVINSTSYTTYGCGYQANSTVIQS
ncbi:unnamed protein product [Caenorhabditis angaria]|uniref:C6 domain-containing protein n=1 Tax=Caenorhabditis angaria TaxID=860376 RepID=A0A9P1NA83_9PELO|nr:unnamed protein product [Caenorhabditis angaria]